MGLRGGIGVYIVFSMLFVPEVPAQALTIWEVSDNCADYAGGQIPRYEKLEISFSIENSLAQNPQLPYDADPPSGLEPEIGITVDAQFTPDNWVTVYTQPAFYYQLFLDETRSGQEWFYPTDQWVWKVRFAPHLSGSWEYRLIASDASGVTESPVYSFQVSPSSRRGFVRVSNRDSRYFEFDDGTYFPALGYNMNYDHVSWYNPVLDNAENFRIMGENGIQLIRIWFSQWSVYGAEWNPWNSQNPSQHGAYLPFNGITFEQAFPGSDVSMKISAEQNPCMFIGSWKARPAIQRGTRYRIQVRYKTQGIVGPTDPSFPYGFVVKTGGWLWSSDETQRCYIPGTGSTLSQHQQHNTPGWEILEASMETGGLDFLPNIFLVMENTSQGSAYVDYVSIQEDMGNGDYGPNIVSKPWMAHHLYFEQRNSYAFDKLLELASQYGVYLRMVIHEKNDRIMTAIDFDGRPDPANRTNDYFYGDWRNPTKIRWLQQAWWRYLQARWGYSTNIHSWELLNEGDPFNGRHYTLADEFGKYMRQFEPNHHLVSTSTWHSFPKHDFWSNQNYPNIDFADVHRYVVRDKQTTLRIDSENFIVNEPWEYYDSAEVTRGLSDLLGAYSEHAIGKPIIRGETGFVLDGSGPADREIVNDQEGIWLHNLIWGGINPGGVIESYWYESTHIYKKTKVPGEPAYLEFDHRPQFGNYYRFIQDVPLNNGNYVTADATTSNPDLRVWGQKDLFQDRAHLWIQNSSHTWGNIVFQQELIQPVSGCVSFSGLSPDSSYSLQWWDTYSGVPVSTQEVGLEQDGNLVFCVENLTDDVAVKISPITEEMPLQDATLDVNGDGTVTALSDGLLVLRYLFGFRGDALIDGVLGSGGKRHTATEIEGYLEAVAVDLDIDGSGRTDALNDGVLILRYLFGFRGESLVRGVVSADCQICSAEAIEDRLAAVASPQTIDG